MEPRFYVVIFGSLALALGIFIGGFYVPSPWAPIMITIGAVSCIAIAWVIAAFYLANAMNTDI